MAILHRQLLELARAAYGADYSRIGFLGQVHAFEDTIDRALVGVSGNDVFVGVRGTMPPFQRNDPTPWKTTLDWLNDAALIGLPNRNYPGRVHNGFCDSVERLWQEDGAATPFQTRLRALLQPTGRRLVITGHSKGGPVAQLLAWRIRRDAALKAVPISVVTFAGARPGNQAFADAYTAAGLSCARYEASLDIVPRVPLGGSNPGFIKRVLELFGVDVAAQSYGFVHVGGLAHPKPDHVGDMTSALVRLALSRGAPPLNQLVFVKSHAIAEHSGYDRLVPGYAGR